jgi:hypothetical protein
VNLSALPYRERKKIKTAVSNNRHLMLFGLSYPRRKYSAECDIPIATAVNLSWQSTPSILFFLQSAASELNRWPPEYNLTVLPVGSTILLLAHKKSPFQHD